MKKSSICLSILTGILIICFTVLVGLEKIDSNIFGIVIIPFFMILVIELFDRD